MLIESFLMGVMAGSITYAFNIICKADNKKEIEKAFEKIANLDVSVEELIKKGLSILAR